MIAIRGLGPAVRRELRQARLRAADRVTGALRPIAGSTRSSLSIRLTVFAVASATLLLAWSPVLRAGSLKLAGDLRLGAGLLLSVLTVLAVLTGVLPRGWLPSAALFFATGGWIVSTVSHHETLTLWRLVALAGLLYLLHATAALAAVLPFDAVLPPGVLRRWLARCGIVLVLTAGFAVAAWAAAVQSRSAAWGPLLGSYGGILLAVAIVVLLAATARSAAGHSSRSETAAPPDTAATEAITARADQAARAWVPAKPGVKPHNGSSISASACPPGTGLENQ